MSDAMAGPAPTLAALAGQVHDLSARVDALDTRSEQRAKALQSDLKTALGVLALIHDDDPRARRRLRELRASKDYGAAFSTPDPLVSVVIPTAPNPMTGLVIVVEASHVIESELNLEEAMKLIVSAGLVSPKRKVIAPDDPAPIAD